MFQILNLSKTGLKPKTFKYCVKRFNKDVYIKICVISYLTNQN